MITKKTSEEIKTLEEGGTRLARILHEIASHIRSGMSTKEIDEMALRLIFKAGGEPSFRGYNPHGAKTPYPSAICVSINDEVVHAIPKKETILQEGDLVGLDIGMWWPALEGTGNRGQGIGKQGPLATDMAITIGVGRISETAQKLIDVTRESLYRGIREVRAGARVGDISAAIQGYIEAHHFGVVRDLAGHGVGYRVHEDPFIPNYGKAGQGPRLEENMVIAIEPMATEGTWKVLLDKDEWTFRTADGKLAAHFEHTVVVTKSGYKIITEI